MKRDIALLILIIFAVILAIVLSTEHRINGLAMPLLVSADYEQCAKVDPGPLVPPRKDTFHPQVATELT